jgi:hypothetical protein
MGKNLVYITLGKNKFQNTGKFVDNAAVVYKTRPLPGSN